MVNNKVDGLPALAKLCFHSDIYNTLYVQWTIF